jgi:hypothetical protein
VREGRRVGRSEISSVIMGIEELHPQPNWVLRIVADDGRAGSFDVSPYLEYEAFSELRDPNEFLKVFNGGYFVEWECGADLSADTIEARWKVVGTVAPQMTV